LTVDRLDELTINLMN